MPDEDQEIESSGDEAPETTEEGQAESQDQTQSEEGEEKEDMAELPTGEKVPLTKLSSEWKDKFMPDYTRKSQQLKEAQKELEELREKQRRVKSSATTEEAARDTYRQVVEKLDPNVRQGLTAWAEADLFPRWRAEQAQRDRSQQTRERTNQAFTELEKEWDGTDGKPKYDPSDRDRILTDIGRPGQTIFDPQVLWELEHQTDIEDWRFKQRIKKQKGTTETERTGTTATGQREPSGEKVPAKDKKGKWNYTGAMKRAISRIG